MEEVAESLGYGLESNTTKEVVDMLKLTKKTDYALIAVKHLAEVAKQSHASASAKEIADVYALPQEALAKILQRLAKQKLLVSIQGTNGGYILAREARFISALDVIHAIDGPLAITSCTTHKGNCQQTQTCNVKEPLRKVNETITAVLGKLTIADMMDPEGPIRGGSDGHAEEKAADVRESIAGLVQLG